MNADEWKKVKHVLLEALDLDPEQRSEYIAACGLSDELLSEVRSLSELEPEAQGMMDLSAVEYSRELIVTEDDAAETGGTIDVYRIVREIGRGGMGTVYLAERNDGKFEKSVALKLLKSEMNTPAVRRHFEQEREILAGLKHPNIAVLFDAGTTPEQVPFIAIEYIDGLSITDYCNVNGLNVSERLELFRKVCNAVDHAHRNLVVHRDLKPSNILVTRQGVPKLVDFGISKILSKGYDEADTATITRMGVMTPSYASPEQLQKRAVTTATDIYSLGVILYELLSGRRPFESAEDDIREIYNAVLETAPVAPSIVISDTERSMRHKTVVMDPELPVTPPKTAPNISKRTEPRPYLISSARIRGDLDNIVLKALRKEPERRYSSAEKLSEDIGRHLEGKPVEARPNTFWYRAEKFVKRNRLAVMSGVVIALAVVGGTGAAVWQSNVAEQERAKAEKRFADVRILANSYLFDVYPQIETLEGSLKARETIVNVALKYLDSLSLESSGDHNLQRELATAYEKVGDVEGAINTQSNADIIGGLESYRKAERLRLEVFDQLPNEPVVKEELAQNYYIIAKTLWWANDSTGAEEYFEKAIALRRALLAADPEEAMFQDRLAVQLIDYAAVPAFNFQSEKARPLFEEARTLILDLMDRDPANAHFKKTYTRLLRSYSQDKANAGDYDGAISDLTKSAEITKELIKLSPDDYRLRRTLWINDLRLCEVYIQKADAGNVVSACEAALPFNKESLEKEPNDAVAMNDLAISYFNMARASRIANSHANAIEYAELAIGVMSKLIEASPETNDYVRAAAVYQCEIAENSLKMGKVDVAIENLLSAQIALEKVSATDPKTTTFQYDLLKVYRLLAAAHFKKGSKAKAAELIAKAIEGTRGLAGQKALKASDAALISELEAEQAAYNKK